MMEFTMARAAMMLCGVMLLAAVIPPVSSVFQDEQEADMQEQSETLCRMVDTFYTSQADEMVICLNTVLPHSSSVVMKGYFITILDGDRQYRYDCDHTLVSDQDVYDSNDYVRMTKGDGCIFVEMLTS